MARAFLRALESNNPEDWDYLYGLIALRIGWRDIPSPLEG